MRPPVLAMTAACVLAAACGGPTAPAPDASSPAAAPAGPAWFADVAGQSGLTFVHQSGHEGQRFRLPEIMGGFTHDRVHADIDRLLHFGYDPGNVLFGLLDVPYVRETIEWNYSMLWSLFAFIPIFFVALSPRGDKLRLRYLVTTVLTWIVIGP